MEHFIDWNKVELAASALDYAGKTNPKKYQESVFLQYFYVLTSTVGSNMKIRQFHGLSVI